jgi:hypothetical protein
MTTKIILRVRPDVHRHLGEWKKRAEEIPNPELRKQALMSIETKTFHCEGGSIYALLAGDRYHEDSSSLIRPSVIILTTYAIAAHPLIPTIFVPSTNQCLMP